MMFATACSVPVGCWAVDRPAAQLTAACPTLLAGTAACDVKLTGADAIVPNLNGGLDGVYTVTACESGRPLYTRQESPKNGAQGAAALLLGG